MSHEQPSNNDIAKKLTEKQIEQKIFFLSAAISDAVGIIRNIDVKNQIFLGLCLIPLARIDYLLVKCQYLIKFIYDNKSGILPLLLIAFILCWFICIFTLLWGIVGRFDPKKAVNCEDNKGEMENKKPNGYFFSPGEFRRNRYTQTFETMISRLPQNDEMILREMAYEHMKLCYIRHIKTFWHRCFLFSFAVWVVFGGILIVILQESGFNFSM